MLESSQLNCERSGTTACSIIYCDEWLYIANLGDSRAIMKKKDTCIYFEFLKL